MKTYLKNDLIKLLEQGYTPQEASKKVGIGMATYYRWQKEFPRFRSIAKTAKKVQEIQKKSEQLKKQAVPHKAFYLVYLGTALAGSALGIMLGTLLLKIFFN